MQSFRPHKQQTTQTAQRPGIVGQAKPRFSPAPPIKKSFPRTLSAWSRDKTKKLRTNVGNLSIRTKLAVIVSIGLILAYAWLRQPNMPTAPATTPATSPEVVSGQLSKGTPQYDTLLPAGKTIEQLGGWTRVSPPKAGAVYAYPDAIGKVPINVSQQPLPKEFKPDTAEKVESLALDYAATETFSVEGTKVYVGTSAKGPQSVILTKNDLLILIKASAEISNKRWATYIRNLQ